MSILLLFETMYLPLINTTTISTFFVPAFFIRTLTPRLFTSALGRFCCLHDADFLRQCNLLVKYPDFIMAVEKTGVALLSSCNIVGVTYATYKNIINTRKFKVKTHFSSTAVLVLNAVHSSHQGPSRLSCVSHRVTSSLHYLLKYMH